jgi:hypothetical protein
MELTMPSSDDFQPSPKRLVLVGGFLGAGKMERKRILLDQARIITRPTRNTILGVGAEEGSKQEIPVASLAE